MADISKSIVCLMGPTASGKTAASLALAKQLPVEIVSVDSAMVYRGLDIGSAKPAADVLQQFPHHLIDICQPHQPYSAADFCCDAKQAINDIHHRKKLPLLVGGTMMYYKALQQGLSQLPSANHVLRQRFETTAKQKGWHYLHQQLQQHDSSAAARIHPNDTQRIQRALEVCYLTGQPLSQLQRQAPLNNNYHFINIGLIPDDRKFLHQMIADRFDQMLADGLIEEIKQLYQQQDLDQDLPAMRAVGYRQVWQYLQGQYDEETMREKSIVASRQLAKRQLTWLRHWPDLHRFNSQDQGIITMIVDFLRNQISTIE